MPVEDRLAGLDLNSPTAGAGLSVKEVRELGLGLRVRAGITVLM